MFLLLIISIIILSLNCSQAYHLNQSVMIADFNYTNETTFINLSGMNITSVDENVFSDWLNITRIRLSRNNISVIHPNTFNSLIHLNYLSLG